MIDLNWVNLPSLPYGLAGMFAGHSNGSLLCMGGTGFSGKPPWEGGIKEWYKDIYLLKDNQWRRLDEQLPNTLAYGVSVSYENKIILIGGSINAEVYTDEVFSLEWDGNKLHHESYPHLPHPMANMAGTLVDNLIIVIGGMEHVKGEPLNKCYLLDLNDLKSGWMQGPAFPGTKRILPVCAAFEDKFYVFSGENSKINSVGQNARNILHDAYCFKPIKEDGRWAGQWLSLMEMPKGVSAGASPAPVVNNRIMLWGGIDRLTALHTNPSDHPGMPKDILWYDPETNSWNCSISLTTNNSPVTLPTVTFEGSTYFISGEIRPGARTPKIPGVSNQ